MLTVFYQDAVWAVIPSWRDWRAANVHTHHREVYDRCYIYCPDPKLLPENKQWWRADGTPCLLEDVPKVYRAMQLLLGG
jgi:Pyruvate/2-oxoacid:ferredoxin oxidoreductase delta subunit